MILYLMRHDDGTVELRTAGMTDDGPKRTFGWLVDAYSIVASSYKAEFKHEYRALTCTVEVWQA